MIVTAISTIYICSLSSRLHDSDKTAEARENPKKTRKKSEKTGVSRGSCRQTSELFFHSNRNLIINRADYLQEFVTNQSSIQHERTRNFACRDMSVGARQAEIAKAKEEEERIKQREGLHNLVAI